MILTHPVPSPGQEDLPGELRNLVGQEDETFLLSEIKQVEANSVLQVEERKLAQTFGEDWLVYKAEVRRWV
jgi:hypothetical protein